MTFIQSTLLRQIKILSQEILNQYAILKSLEIAGKTESEEFKKEITLLNKNIYSENLLYDELGSDPNSLSIILDDITMACLAWDLDVDFILLLENKAVDLVDRRIILRICDKINDSKQINPLMPLIVGNPNVDADSYRYGKLSISTRKDFLNTILTLLNQQIFMEQNENVRAKLIELKYNISYFYQFVESDFAANDFRVNPQLVWNSPSIASVNQIDQNMVTAYQVHYAVSIMNRPIERLAETRKKDLSNNDTYFTAIVYQILIRACLLFGKNDMVKKLNECIKKNFSHKNAIYMVKEAIDMYEIDKTIPWVVNLNL